MTPSLALDFARALDPTLIARDVGPRPSRRVAGQIDRRAAKAAPVLLWPPGREIDCCRGAPSTRSSIRRRSRS
jgi:hypothetical protein